MESYLRRRDFVTLIAGVAIEWPRTAAAQRALRSIASAFWRQFPPSRTPPILMLCEKGCVNLAMLRDKIYFRISLG